MTAAFAKPAAATRMSTTNAYRDQSTHRRGASAFCCPKPLLIHSSARMQYHQRILL